MDGMIKHAGSGLDPIAIDPSGLIRAAVERVRERLRLRDPDGRRAWSLDLELLALETLVLVPEHLSRLLEHLLLSICDAMPSGGVILINASSSAGQLTVTLEPQRIARAGGVNAARAIGRALIEAREIARIVSASEPAVRLGARLTVEVRADTSAIITLALASAGAASVTAVDPGEPIHERSSDPRGQVLIIDDDCGSRDALHEALELKGYAVAAASNGYEGLAVLSRAARVDFVICDLEMPGMDGWAVARQSAAIAPEIPVLLISGGAGEVSPADPRRKLVVDVLAKPIDLEVIEALISRSTK
ncbi:MAG TPA: response regulator [Candidatus Binataceae bacterium]|nr:response regulator [Candidatus Binataceae bacterium]